MKGLNYDICCSLGSVIDVYCAWRQVVVQRLDEKLILKVMVPLLIKLSRDSEL